jgi:hypothetical protein
MTHSRHAVRRYRLSDNRARPSPPKPPALPCATNYVDRGPGWPHRRALVRGVTVKPWRPQLRDAVPANDPPAARLLCDSPLNAESLAKKRQPTGGRRNLADRLLSLATMEFQHPAVTSVGATANVARASLHPTT